MAVLTSKSGGSGPRSPKGEERFENMKLYKKRGCVEKSAAAIKSYLSTSYVVEKTCSKSLTFDPFGGLIFS
jgi:hypothetical protein